MPRIVNEYEKHLARLGYMVATAAGAQWICSKCKKGALLLTRDVSPAGVAGPAVFRCYVCDDTLNIYPANGGGVQPALKGFTKVKTTSTSGTSGGWQ